MPAAPQDPLVPDAPVEEPDTADAPAPRRRRRRRWVFGATIVVIVVAWLGLCAYRMVQADHDLRQAVARSEQLRASLTTQELTNGGATPHPDEPNS